MPPHSATNDRPYIEAWYRAKGITLDKSICIGGVPWLEFCDTEKPNPKSFQTIHLFPGEAIIASSRQSFRSRSGGAFVISVILIIFGLWGILLNNTLMTIIGSLLIIAGLGFIYLIYFRNVYRNGYLSPLDFNELFITNQRVVLVDYISHWSGAYFSILYDDISKLRKYDEGIFEAALEIELKVELQPVELALEEIEPKIEIWPETLPKSWGKRNIHSFPLKRVSEIFQSIRQVDPTKVEVIETKRPLLDSLPFFKTPRFYERLPLAIFPNPFCYVTIKENNQLIYKRYGEIYFETPINDLIVDISKRTAPAILFGYGAFSLQMRGTTKDFPAVGNITKLRELVKECSSRINQ